MMNEQIHQQSFGLGVAVGLFLGFLLGALYAILNRVSR